MYFTRLHNTTTNAAEQVNLKPQSVLVLGHGNYRCLSTGCTYSDLPLCAYYLIAARRETTCQLPVAQLERYFPDACLINQNWQFQFQLQPVRGTQSWPGTWPRSYACSLRKRFSIKKRVVTSASSGSSSPCPSPPPPLPTLFSGTCAVCQRHRHRWLYGNSTFMQRERKKENAARKRFPFPVRLDAKLDWHRLGQLVKQATHI